MGLATRVIPVLLHRGTQLVKGKQFDSSRVVGHVLQAVRTHQARGVDELIVLDVAATLEGRGPDFKLIEQITRDCFSPITIGGGVRSVQDVRDLLNAGADKVAICTAFDGMKILNKYADRFGSQAIVVSIDYKPIDCHDGRYLCGWNKNGVVPILLGGMPMSPITLAVQAAKDGAGEILFQSIRRDGMMIGYDIELILEVSQSVSIPVIAAGGASGYEDMRLAIKAGASAVAAGALFQFTDCTPQGAAKYLQEHGVEARIASN